MMREMLIVVLSAVFTIRTYNILRSNLFVLFDKNYYNNSVGGLKDMGMNGRRVGNSFHANVNVNQIQLTE